MSVRRRKALHTRAQAVREGQAKALRTKKAVRGDAKISENSAVGTPSSAGSKAYTLHRLGPRLYFFNRASTRAAFRGGALDDHAGRASSGSAMPCFSFLSRRDMPKDGLYFLKETAVPCNA